MFASSRFIKRAAAKNRTETELSRRDETRRRGESNRGRVLSYGIQRVHKLPSERVQYIFATPQSQASRRTIHPGHPASTRSSQLPHPCPRMHDCTCVLEHYAGPCRVRLHAHRERAADSAARMTRGTGWDGYACTCAARVYSTTCGGHR